MKEKKKSIGDIVAYSDTKKGGLIAGVFFVCIGMVLSIFPIVAIYHIIKILLSTNSSNTIIITYSLYGIIAVIIAYIFSLYGMLFFRKVKSKS